MEITSGIFVNHFSSFSFPKTFPLLFLLWFMWQQQPRQLEQAKHQAATVKWIKSISSYSSNVSSYAGVSRSDPKPHLATVATTGPKCCLLYVVDLTFHWRAGGGTSTSWLAGWLDGWLAGWQDLGRSVGHAAQSTAGQTRFIIELIPLCRWKRFYVSFRFVSQRAKWLTTSGRATSGRAASSEQRSCS